MVALIGILGFIPVGLAQTGLKAGDVVNTNFSFINRFLWTNETGQVFAPSNSVIRLSDFDGKIVFFEFFAVW